MLKCEFKEKSICFFVLVKIYEGTVADRHWLSNNGELAFTFTNPKIIENCVDKLILSDQCFGISKRNYNEIKNLRSKRETYTGVVLSPQLASQLQASEDRIELKLKRNFVQSLNSNCFNR